MGDDCDGKSPALSHEIETLSEQIKLYPVVGSTERLKLQKQKFEKQLKLAEILEEQRVKDVQKEALESGMVLNLAMPAQVDGDECPLCFSPFEGPKMGGPATYCFLPCCRKFICSSCNDEAGQMVEKAETEEELLAVQASCMQCPFCRRDIPADEAGITKQLIASAERGCMYAQYMLGGMLLDGEDIKKDEKQAVVWYQRAAAQGHIDSQNILGQLYFSGCSDVGIDQSHEKAREYFSKCALQGCAHSQFLLGFLEFENNKHDVALKWYTLSAAQEYPEAMEILALFDLFDECGMESSLHRDFLLAKKAALVGSPRAQYHYARLLMRAATEAYDGLCILPGYCVLPEAYYFAQKALTENDDPSSEEKFAELVQILESNRDERCRCCRKPPAADERLRCCTRCHAVAYCNNRDCQRNHWEMGHQVDCFVPP